LKRYEVHFLAEAVADLDSLFRFIAEKSNYEIADGYLERIEHFCRSLETFPQRGTKIPGRVAGVRAMGFEQGDGLVLRRKRARGNPADSVWRTRSPHEVR
jgi:plasmid stabilization system protein ParE